MITWLTEAGFIRAGCCQKEVFTSTLRISNQYQPAVSWAVLREAAVVVADADFGLVGVVVGVVGVVVVEVVGVGVEESSVGLSSAS